MLEALGLIKNEIDDVKALDLCEIEGKKALVVVDMVKGFYSVGALASDRTGRVIDSIVSLSNALLDEEKLFFIDSHKEDAVEFLSFPPHCVEETVEEELIDEIKDLTNGEHVTILKKNSINGFHAKGFMKWLLDNKDIDSFIVTGVCTNICVETFVISLKTYFNENNIAKNIYVPMNTVETYDFGSHNGDLMNLLSFYKMKQNGINVVKNLIV